MIIKRDSYIDKLVSYKDKELIKVITGVRTCGKSILLFNLFYNYLINEIKVDKDNILLINLESFSNIELRQSNRLYEYVKEKVDLLKEENKYNTTDKKVYIFIDEIQYVDNFEDLLNGLKVDFNSDIYVTGSNSKLLSSEINTKLRGRSIEIKVFPLSFSEFYKFNLEKENFSKLDIQSFFDIYIKYGGLPYLVSEDSNQKKIEYLDMIKSTTIEKDLIERYHIKEKFLFKSFIKFLASNISCYVSSTNITNYLKSNGFSRLSKDTIIKYLDFVDDSNLFYKTHRYDVKGKEFLKTLNKYYIVDIGLRNIILDFTNIDLSHSIENIVYLELVRRGYKVNIGKNKEKEIDFVVFTSANLYYIQVCTSLEQETVYKREIGSFLKLDDGYKKIVISLDKYLSNTLNNGYKHINLFDFLLNDDILEKI